MTLVVVAGFLLANKAGAVSFSGSTVTAFSLAGGPPVAYPALLRLR
ncbi:hypothetical protein [Kaistia sp. 32K]|nr:hypothetical protein [Kaistia sp. 32K]